MSTQIGCIELAGYTSARMPRAPSKKRPSQGARLFELRRQAGLTQAELARLVDDTQRNIAYWEQSEKPPRSDVLPKLAEVLGVRLEDLLDVSRPPSRRASPSGRMRQLFDEIAGLPRRQQAKVAEFLQLFLTQFKRGSH